MIPFDLMPLKKSCHKKSESIPECWRTTESSIATGMVAGGGPWGVEPFTGHECQSRKFGREGNHIMQCDQDRRGALKGLGAGLVAATLIAGRSAEAAVEPA